MKEDPVYILDLNCWCDWSHYNEFAGVVNSLNYKHVYFIRIYSVMAVKH